ncbi:hypothetical protein [uncultured Jatrophihabitans sp.]|uniref:hypothetical protein n=1 Tax=uncultured Jatrophihabitans sp. TaxID=1610747 RepID=UPI0035C98BB1
MTGIALILIGFGAPYLIRGLGATSVPGAFASIQHLPGGQHTYGGIMLAIGLLLAHAVSPMAHHRPIYWNTVMAALFLAVLFAAAAVIGFALSWAATGVLTWGSMIYWATVMGFAFASIVLSPDREDIAVRPTPTQMQ